MAIHSELILLSVAGEQVEPNEYNRADSLIARATRGGAAIGQKFKKWRK